MLKNLKTALKKRKKQRLDIVLYHFVTDEINEFTLYGHRITTNTFRQQLSYLSDKYQIIPLRNIPKLMSEKISAEGPLVSICFDDGYRSVMSEAYPILQAMEIPATVFICSSTIGNQDILWRDKIRFLITNNLVDDFISYLKMKSPNSNYKFKRLREKSFYTWSKDIKSIADMSIQKDIGDYLSLKAIDLSQTANKYNLFLGENDIKEYDYLDFGNHTATHPLMTCLTYQQQLDEIMSTHYYLKGLGIDPVGLALPFSPYNQDTVYICNKIGYKLILTAEGKSNPLCSSDKDIYILHRLMAPTDLHSLQEAI